MTIDTIDSDFKSDLIGFFEELDGTISKQPSEQDQRISSIAKKWKQEEDDRPLHLPGIRPMMMKMQEVEGTINGGCSEKEGFKVEGALRFRFGVGREPEDKEESSSTNESDRERDPPDTRDREGNN
jgi:hypothetical protein